MFKIGLRYLAPQARANRVYHFFINERGNLYHLYDVDSVLPSLRRVASGSTDRTGLPSGPAHIRDPSFINFFIKNIHKNQEQLKAKIDSTLPTAFGDPSIFPYVSFCGSEINFVACEKQPIVFHTLEITGSNQFHAHLVFAGNLREEFDPNRLRVDSEGYLYHMISCFESDTVVRRGQAYSRPTIGLVGADVGLKLGFEFIDEGAETGYVIRWSGNTIAIPLLVIDSPLLKSCR